MKKVACISLVSLLFLTGCGTKKLKCSMVNDANTELKINQDVVIAFKKDKMVKVDMETIVNLSDSYASYADELEENLKKEYEKYEKKEGLKINTTKKDKKVTLTFSADLEKIDDKTKEEFDFVGIEQTIDEVKKEFEGQGYSCKEA